jgi:hypothetical protein
LITWWPISFHGNECQHSGSGCYSKVIEPGTDPTGEFGRSCGLKAALRTALEDKLY